MFGIEEWLDCMPFEGTLHQHAGWSKAGDPLEGTDIPVQCYAEGGAHRVTDDDGTEVTAKTMVFLGSIIDINPNSTFTLPIGFTPRKRRPILHVDTESDEAGIHHTVLHLG